MKRNKLLEKIGFRYLVNLKSKEIHRVSFLKESCNLSVMVHAFYAPKLLVLILLRYGFNGCCHCYTSKNNES
ncbi:MAG: hypothetical protein M0R37_03970 [Bacteroidales bacterium]|nr:hypothetical protein [Bacteroidales bacterium]